MSDRAAVSFSLPEEVSPAPMPLANPVSNPLAVLTSIPFFASAAIVIAVYIGLPMVLVARVLLAGLSHAILLATSLFAIAMVSVLTILHRTSTPISTTGPRQPSQPRTPLLPHLSVDALLERER